MDIVGFFFLFVVYVHTYISYCMIPQCTCIIITACIIRIFNTRLSLFYTLWCWW